jgi:hypothetical protein
VNSTTTTAGTRLRARIERILKQFASDDIKPFVSGINNADDLGAIEDGQYGDPTQSSKPDFVQKELSGWE